MPGDFHFAKMEDMESIMHCTGKKELYLQSSMSLTLELHLLCWSQYFVLSGCCLQTYITTCAISKNVRLYQSFGKHQHDQGYYM